RMLTKAMELENNARRYLELMPEGFKDTYYQLVYYPAAASANIFKMQIYAGLNRKYYNLKSVLANRYAALVKETIAADGQMQSYYNDTMSGGKWQGIMSSAHVGYVNWDATGWHYPEVYHVTPEAGASMTVDVEGSEEGYTTGAAVLPAFTNLKRESYRITVSNSGKEKFNCTAETSEDWIKLDSHHFSITDGNTVRVSVDWDKVTKNSRGVIRITGAGQTVNVNVDAIVIDADGLPEKTFVETNNVISIEAEHTANRVAKASARWKVIENYGRTLSALKMYPTTVSFERAEEAPYLEYRVYTAQEDEYTLTAYCAPTNNLYNGGRLRYCVSFDGSAPVVADTLPAGFAAGNHDNALWCKGVVENIHTAVTRHTLTKGTHTLRFYGLDAGLVLQKLVLSSTALPYSYLGPEESYYKK
ncbi:MAG TPA: hypothetical protein VHP38_13410, partial [Ruminiclostridium sp.]|nr:hypothetical protein [Ruminiclostridium sp.]